MINLFIDYNIDYILFIYLKTSKKIITASLNIVTTKKRNIKNMHKFKFN
jgi:hypothetical protein